LKKESADDVRALVLQAVATAKGGDWKGAHETAQAHEGHPLADWLHAIAHRMEGDLGNARYWYRRCGRERHETLALADELTLIEGAAREAAV